MRKRKPEELKDSGIEWIGFIPNKWDTSSLKYYTLCLDGARVPLNGEERAQIPGEIPYWGSNGIVDYVGDFIFDDELLLLGEDGAPFFDPFKDVAFNVSGKVWINNHIHVLKPKGINIDYITYFLNTVDYKEYIKGSTRDKLNQSDMGAISIVTPDLDEQKAIATFLDHKTQAIDKLIDKKQQLIEKLKEKRQTLITRAVTKGLNPDAPMKDSGTEWLGEIPGHWDEQQIRRVIEKFVDYRGSTPQKIDSGIPLITAANIDDETIDYTNVEVFISEEEYKNRMVRGFPKKGDVLVTTEAPLGEVAQIKNEKVALAQRIILFKTKPTLDNDFLMYYLLSDIGQNELLSRATGSTAVGIKGSKLKGIAVIIPPIKEQEIIAEYLINNSLKIFEAIEKVEKQIEKLKEYRQSLISATVTGKIDVAKKNN